MKPAVHDILELSIERLTYNGGRGIGRHFNFAIFVEGPTAPNDVVKVKIKKLKKNYAVADLISIVNPSENRVKPSCQYYNKCGGCQWQHINYKQQVVQKKSFIEYTLRRLKIDNKVNFIQSENNFNYRNRIQLHYQDSKLGYFQKKTNHIVSIKECIIADKKINTLIQNFKAQHDVKRYEFAITTDHDAVYYPVKKRHPHNLFSQINNDINEKLIELVLEHSRENNFSHIYDAYCGSGNFTHPLKENFPKTSITGIELSSNNIKLAKQQNPDIEFKEKSVEKYFAKQPAIEESLLVLDPPRSGCHSSLFNNITNASKIIYISCDLATFERDCKEILNNQFKLTQIYGLDMFPQTYHLETFAVFDKIN